MARTRTGAIPLAVSIRPVPVSWTVSVVALILVLTFASTIRAAGGGYRGADASAGVA